MPRLSPLPALLLLTVLALAVLAAAVSLGSASGGPVEFWRDVAAGDPLALTLLTELRWPRALTGFAVGAVLALAGVLMQALLRNPLADPYILGVSGGAGVGAVAALLAGVGAVLVNVAAAAGALAAMLTVFVLAHGRGGWTPTRLLLTGVVLAAGCGAAISLMLSLADERQLRGLLFWLMGDLSQAEQPLLLAAFGLVALGLSLVLARTLNVLARGELQAQMLGVPVRRVGLVLYAAASLLTAAAVVTAGSIGFVGLVTPHLARLALGADHRIVAPAAALLGGTLVVAADTVARTAFAPQQLPVGALTALVGVPLFFVLLGRRRALT